MSLLGVACHKLKKQALQVFIHKISMSYSREGPLYFLSLQLENRKQTFSIFPLQSKKTCSYMREIYSYTSPRMEGDKTKQQQQKLISNLVERRVIGMTKSGLNNTTILFALQKKWAFQKSIKCLLFSS